MVWEVINRKSHENPFCVALRWRHNEHDGISNHQPDDCLLNRLFRRRSKETSKLCVIGLCAGNSLVTGEFLALMASNTENVSIWWHHHGKAAYWHQYSDGLVQESCNSSALAMELFLSCTNPSICINSLVQEYQVSSALAMKIPQFYTSPLMCAWWSGVWALWWPATTPHWPRHALTSTDKNTALN